MPEIAVDRKDRVASEGECADPTLMLRTERPTAGEGGSDPLILKRTSWHKRAEKRECESHTQLADRKEEGFKGLVKNQHQAWRG